MLTALPTSIHRLFAELTHLIRGLCTRGSFRESKAKRGEKAQFTSVNEHFEPIFNTAIAENGLVQRSRYVMMKPLFKMHKHASHP